jgi:thiamine-phosphate pyrophosphorylase
MKPIAECRLYAFVDTACLRGRAAEEVAQSLCEGGADLIQLRAKTASTEVVRSMAKALHPLTQAANVGLVINDSLEIAEQTGAELCHLGQEDFFGAGFRHVSELKKRDPKLQIGLSTHSPEQARRAVAAGADYIAIGPVFATATKPDAKPVTLELVRWAAGHVSVPWFAIGGITLGNVDEVLAAGAKRVCVVSAILNAPDIAAACREFRRKILGSAK